MPNGLLWILLLALIVRVLVVVFLPNQGLPDAVSYRTAAQEFRHLQLMVDPNIMPLYPLLLAVVGVGGWGQKMADVALSLASVWFVFAIALQVYRDEVIARIAALFCALWPHFAFFAAIGLTETLFTALVLAAFFCLYGRWFVVASVCLVLAILTRPAIELFAPFIVMLFSLVIHREPLPVAGKRLLVYAIVYVVLMGPWWAYNYARYDQFVRLNLSGGMVLYTGNNPHNISGGGISKNDVDFSPFVHIDDRIARDRAMRDAAIAYIKTDPWHFVAMMPVKFARLWRPWPFASEYQNPLIVAVSAISAVPTFILALLGLATTLRPYFVRLLPCLAYLAFLTLVHMITIGSVRYRVPMEPFVLILASAGLAGLLRQMKSGRRLLAALSAR